MTEFPHRYTITADSATAGNVRLASERLPDLASALPAEFGGPGDQWSPETLLVAAVGDCYVLTFRAVAAASKLAWTSLSCSVIGTLVHPFDPLAYAASLGVIVATCLAAAFLPARRAARINPIATLRAD